MKGHINCLSIQLFILGKLRQIANGSIKVKQCTIYILKFSVLLISVVCLLIHTENIVNILIANLKLVTST